MIRMSCWFADYRGQIAASAEIAAFEWFTYADRERSAPVDRIIFDDLRERGLLAPGST
jgi:8-oxo-dGTP diphosphatase